MHPLLSKLEEVDYTTVAFDLKRNSYVKNKPEQEEACDTANIA